MSVNKIVFARNDSSRPKCSKVSFLRGHSKMIDTSFELSTLLEGRWSVRVGCAESPPPILNVGISAKWRLGIMKLKIGNPIKTNTIWYIRLCRFVCVMERRVPDQKLSKAIATGRRLENDRYVLRVMHIFGRSVIGRGRVLSRYEERGRTPFFFSYAQTRNLKSWENVKKPLVFQRFCNLVFLVDQDSSQLTVHFQTIDAFLISHGLSWNQARLIRCEHSCQGTPKVSIRP